MVWARPWSQGGSAPACRHQLSLVPTTQSAPVPARQTARAHTACEESSAIKTNTTKKQKRIKKTRKLKTNKKNNTNANNKYKHKYKYAPVPAYQTTRAHTVSPDQNINRTKERDMIGKDQRALSLIKKESGSGF